MAMMSLSTAFFNALMQDEEPDEQFFGSLADTNELYMKLAGSAASIRANPKEKDPSLKSTDRGPTDLKTSQPTPPEDGASIKATPPQPPQEENVPNKGPNTTYIIG